MHALVEIDVLLTVLHLLLDEDVEFLYQPRFRRVDQRFGLHHDLQEIGLYIGWNQGGRVRSLRELLVRRPMRANIGKIELRKSCFHFGILGMSYRGPPRLRAPSDEQSAGYMCVLALWSSW